MIFQDYFCKAKAVEDQDHDLNVDDYAKDSRILAAKVFQLTEWVYKASYQGNKTSFSHVVGVYVKCLDWYASLLDHERHYHNDHQFILFSQ